MMKNEYRSAVYEHVNADVEEYRVQRRALDAAREELHKAARRITLLHQLLAVDEMVTEDREIVDVSQAPYVRRRSRSIEQGRYVP